MIACATSEFRRSGDELLRRARLSTERTRDKHELAPNCSMHRRRNWHRVCDRGGSAFGDPALGCCVVVGEGRPSGPFGTFVKWRGAPFSERGHRREILLFFAGSVLALADRRMARAKVPFVEDFLTAKELVFVNAGLLISACAAVPGACAKATPRPRARAAPIVAIFSMSAAC